MRTIERYLLGWILGALGLGSLVMALVAYLVTLDEMDEVYDANLKHVAQALGSYTQGGPKPLVEIDRKPDQSGDAPEAEEILTILWTADGRRVYSSDPRVDIPFLSQEALTRIRVGRDDWIVYTDVSQNGVAQAAQRADARHETAVEAASQIFPSMVGLMLLVAALLIFALRRGLRPLDEATRDIAVRTARTLAPMTTTDVPGELSPLVQAINGLMARLSEALASQRRFLGDAAHELRTPITVLRLQLQLLKRSAADEERREAMAELERGIDRSQRLIEQLLQVARSDPDAAARSRQRVDLAELVRDVVVTLSAKAEQLGIDLGANAAHEIVVRGERQELTVLLINLVENSLRYTADGGVVDVEACAIDERPALRVIDNGPGIPGSERGRVFDRFFRGADAHELARDAGGSGLGLAIVHAIAERHDATVSLHTPPGGQGLEVRVVFASNGEPEPDRLKNSPWS